MILLIQLYNTDNLSYNRAIILSTKWPTLLENVLIFFCHSLCKSWCLVFKMVDISTASKCILIFSCQSFPESRCYVSQMTDILSHFCTKLFELQALRKQTFLIYDLQNVPLPAAILWPLMNCNVVFVIIEFCSATKIHKWPIHSSDGHYRSDKDSY